MGSWLESEGKRAGGIRKQSAKEGGGSAVSLVSNRDIREIDLVSTVLSLP